MSHLKEKIEKIIKRPYSDERELLYHLKQVILETDVHTTQVRESKDITQLVNESIKQVQDKMLPVNVVKTGFTELDRHFGGFLLGEFIVIGGRPAMGKTQFLVNICLNISTSNPLLYFTYDLSEFLLTNRFISSMTGIPIGRLLQHELTEDESQKLASVTNKFGKHKILINDSCNSSVSELKAVCKKHIEENGVKVIVVDYLQMMSSNKYRNTRELEISYISRELKNIAKEYNVCVIANSQLSRSVETRGGDKCPQLSDLRESGAIEQDADKVLFLYRPEYYGIEFSGEGESTAGIAEIIIAKNRNGSLGKVKLMRDSEFTSFRDFTGFKKDFEFSKNRLDEIDKIY